MINSRLCAQETLQPAPDQLIPEAKRKGRKEKRFSTGQMEAYKLYEKFCDEGVAVEDVEWPPLYTLSIKGYNPETQSGDTPERRRLRAAFKRRYSRNSQKESGFTN